MNLSVICILIEFLVLTVSAFISVVVWKRAKNGLNILFSLLIIFQFIAKILIISNKLFFFQNIEIDSIASIFMLCSSCFCFFGILELYKRK